MTLDNYKIVVYRNRPDGWVAEEALAELEDVFQRIAAEYKDREQPLPEDATEIVVGTPGHSIAEGLREFWRSHRVTGGKRDWTRDDLHSHR
jgi:hypothetical protein